MARTVVELPDVDVLVRVDAGDGAARHVAHVVHAGLHRAQADRPQALPAPSQGKLSAIQLYSVPTTVYIPRPTTLYGQASKQPDSTRPPDLSSEALNHDLRSACQTVLTCQSPARTRGTRPGNLSMTSIKAMLQDPYRFSQDAICRDPVNPPQPGCTHLEDLVGLGQGHAAQLDVGARGDVAAAALQVCDLVAQEAQLRRAQLPVGHLRAPEGHDDVHIA